MQVMFSSAAKRRLAGISPVVAAALLTAAAFLLPSPGAGHGAQASAGQFELFNVLAAFQ